MAKNNTRLELTWIGKENRPQLEPRILIEVSEKSYHAKFQTQRGIADNVDVGSLEAGKQRKSEVHVGDFFDNRLIFGDNLLALKALEQEFTGKIKCIFIDPPYNTGSAFSHYDDGVEHSIWLSLIRDRLELLRRLLLPEGSIWITIDDSEGHYLKVLLDEVFSRANSLGTVTWQKTTSIHNNAELFSSATDMVLVYAKDVASFKMGRIPRSERNLGDYSNPDDDPRGPWASSPLHVSLTSGQRGKQYALTGKSSGLFPIVNSHGKELFPPKGRCWAYSPDSIEQFEKENLLWWGEHGHNQPRLKRYLRESKEGVVPSTLWLSEEVGHNQEAKAENSTLLPDLAELFSTPKPERLLKRVIELSTIPGDIVLDSFAGSGTTGAVAHKMGRRWIMVELGEHCHTHIIPRLKKVIDGEDQGGISKEVNWQGGGGFRYYRLGPSLIVEDEWSNPIINPEFNAGMLAEAMCKLEGFVFEPNADVYWQHGQGAESAFIYVTTQMMTKDMLTKLSDEVGPNRSLLICCSAFRCDVSQFENLSVKKIPTAVLKKCEWGHDDYSLEIKNLPMRTMEDGPEKISGEKEKTPSRRFGKGKQEQEGLTLFDIGEIGLKEGK